MHFLSSNFNLISSNSLWDELKKKEVFIDSNFDNFYLSLLDNKIYEKYNTFHLIIFLNKKNYKETKKKILSLQKNFKKFSAKKFFLYFFCENSFKISKNKKINLEINQLKNLSKNLSIENFFQNKSGILLNTRNLKIIKFPFDVTAITFFSKKILEKINILGSKPYKLIILDCDNTLWGGILDEDKNYEIAYGGKKNGIYFQIFQKVLKELKNKGFLLSLCSKNNEKKVWNFFKSRKMILQKKDFILSKIDWNEKADNISSIVKNLDLRFEDCIFIDDNILEIKKVKSQIKNINTLHLKKIVNIKNTIDKDPRFKKLYVSQSDKAKHKQYILKSKFTRYVDNAEKAPNLIKGLKQKINILNCNNKNLHRAEELFKKTNQFNFSLNRYKNNEILNLIKKKNCDIRLFKLKDKFGNHGIIGIYVVKLEDKKILISDFLLSCRVLSRYVEEYIFCYIINKYLGKKIEILYKKTKVNSNLIPKFLKNFKLLRKIKNNFYYEIKFKQKYINETEKIFSN